jgi:hypothetical protein
MPELERALRVCVDDAHTLALHVRLGGKLRRQRGFAGTALAGRECDDVHASHSL